MDFNFNLNGKIEVHHTFHSVGMDEALQRLRDIQKSLGELAMALSQDYKDLAAAIDTATTQVANQLTILQGQVKNSMTDQEVADTKAAFQAEIDRLTGMGQDPNNPIPPPTPQLKKKP